MEKLERKRREVSLRRSLKQGGVFWLLIGLFAGYMLGLVVVHVFGSDVFSFPVGSCDYLLIAPSVPRVSVSGVRVCYTEMPIPANVVVCPTKYSVAFHTIPEINADALSRAKQWCDSVRIQVDRQMLQRELNAGGDVNEAP